MRDVAIVGSGPNGLSAAVTLARAGLTVDVIERAERIGGAAASVNSTLPGFVHDVASAVHPMSLASPFFRAFRLAERIPIIVPELSYAHLLDDGRAGMAYRDLAQTADGLGRDGVAWTRLFGPLVARLEGLMDAVGGSLVRLPRDPRALVGFALRALEQGSPAAGLRFTGDVAPAMLAALAAHSPGRIPHPVRAGAGLVLGAQAHGDGWAIPVGGTGAITDALRDDFIAHGGRVHTGIDVADVDDLDAELVVLDVSAVDAARLAGRRFPPRYRKRLQRTRYGAGAFVLDVASSDPVPWRTAELASAATVHLGGDRAALARDERWPGVSIRPYVLLSQPTVHDPSRAPAGRHVLWAYTHVAHGSHDDRTDIVLDAIERHAPGFRDTVLAVRGRSARDLQAENPNLVGGDLTGGVLDLRQTLARPRFAARPWRTPDPRVYLGSSAASPGPGVHGLAGWHAARTLLADHFPDRGEVDLTPQG